jgi:hypothetical protein
MLVYSRFFTSAGLVGAAAEEPCELEHPAAASASASATSADRTGRVRNFTILSGVFEKYQCIKCR